jgi:hypothetical protein
VRRGAEALGLRGEGRLCGLHKPATAGFALLAEGFTPTARAAPQKHESHPPNSNVYARHAILMILTDFGEMTATGALQ